MPSVHQIPRDVDAPARARRAVDAIADRIAPDIRPDVALLVSELVTNSVRYGAGAKVGLVLDVRAARCVHAEVTDAGPGFVPGPRDRGPCEPGGWGLALVEALADRWGVATGATRVWFEIER